VALLIASQGWRTASLVAGITILVVVLPLCFFVRSTPESVGLLPDGRPPENPHREQRPETQNRASVEEVEQADFELKEAIHTRSYWLLLIGSILRLTAKSGVILHIIPIMVWKGIDPQTGAFIFGALLFLTVPLSLLFGWLADRFPKNFVLFISAVSGTVSFFLLATSATSISRGKRCLHFRQASRVPKVPTRAHLPRVVVLASHRGLYIEPFVATETMFLVHF